MFDFNSKKNSYEQFENSEINMDNIDQPIEPTRSPSAESDSEPKICRICFRRSQRSEYRGRYFSCNFWHSDDGDVNGRDCDAFWGYRSGLSA